jgi:hypothetical protein
MPTETSNYVLVENPNDYYTFTANFTIDDIDNADDFCAVLVVSDNDDPFCENCDEPFTNDNFPVYVESHNLTIHINDLPAHTADRVRALRA